MSEYADVEVGGKNLRGKHPFSPSRAVRTKAHHHICMFAAPTIGNGPINSAADTMQADAQSRIAIFGNGDPWNSQQRAFESPFSLMDSPVFTQRANFVPGLSVAAVLLDGLVGQAFLVLHAAEGHVALSVCDNRLDAACLHARTAHVR